MLMAQDLGEPLPNPTRHSGRVTVADGPEIPTAKSFNWRFLSPPLVVIMTIVSSPVRQAVVKVNHQFAWRRSWVPRNRHRCL